MCKLDLKDAYFSVPLDRNSRKFVRFQWKGTLYEFICLCFGLGPAPRVFTKLLKIPISLLRKINIRVIIYLDDMLILSHTIREAHMSRDMGFIINIKKSILHPCQKIKFLGMETDSIKMTLSLTPEKVQKVVKTCQNLLRSHSTTLVEFTRVVGLLSSTIQAVEPAKIIQQQQIVCLREKNELSVSNNTKSRTELTWWIENLRFCNGRTFSQLNPQVIIQTDASLTGGEQSAMGFKHQGNGQRKREPYT